MERQQEVPEWRYGPYRPPDLVLTRNVAVTHKWTS